MRLSSSRSTAILHRPQQDFLLWDKAGTRPSLDLQFADRKDLVDATTGSNLVDFTRASSGTYVGSDGLIKTATTNEARFDHDPVTGESLGLLVEEQRSNLLLNSGTLATQDVTVTAVEHTLSFYGSGTVALSGTHAATVVGTGAYPARTTLTFTPTAGTLTATVSGTVEYANLEIGSFATSYIPTTDSTVTRAADVASITGANFSSWYRQDEGTVFAEINRNTSISRNLRAFSVTDGTTNNRVFDLRQDTSSLGYAFSVASGVIEVLQSVEFNSGSQNNKVAISQSLNNFGVSTNGGSVLADTSVTMPIVNQISIGSLNGASQFAGAIRRLVYWDQRLPNDTLETITQ